jgi:hypothetical protein
MLFVCGIHHEATANLFGRQPGPSFKDSEHPVEVDVNHNAAHVKQQRVNVVWLWHGPPPGALCN